MIFVSITVTLRLASVRRSGQAQGDKKYSNAKILILFSIFVKWLPEELEKHEGKIKAAIGALALGLFLFRFLPILTSPGFHAFIERQGTIFGPVIIILYIVASQVFAPLFAGPALIVSFAVFGITKTIIFSLIGSYISAGINFYISQRFGRGIVKKFAGEKSMVQIDEFVENFGTGVLVIARLFGVTIFDVVSYAAGLTKISFRTYMVITLVVTPIPKLLFLFFFRDTDVSSLHNLLLLGGAFTAVSFIFLLLFKKYVAGKKGI